MDLLDPSRIERYRQELRDEETPEPEPLEAQELHDVWQQGNRRRPVPPKLSDRHKADLVDLKRRWIIFAAKMGRRDWKGLIKTLSYENKGLGESFMRYLMRQAELQGKPIRSENAIRMHTRKLGGLYRKYNAHPPGRSLMDHLRNVIRSEITRKWALRREPKIKPIMGPDFFMYHLYFLWVRDTSAFHIGLDRIDDACLRMFYMWTGCRKHELIYAKPTDLTAKVKEYDEESDAYTDVECSTDKYIKPRVKRCWVCDRVDERDNDPRLKVLCWEDIDLWVLRDPEGNGGRDRLAMQVLLRYHKGENNKIVPTWYIFIEEALPALCPITHILAKALAEGVIANEGYQTKAEPFFTTKLNKRALKVRWKKEWLHKPVFRKTELGKSVEKKSEMEIRPATPRDALFGEAVKEKEVRREVLNFGDGSNLWEKSNDALTAAIFDGHSERLRIAMGLLEKLVQYCQRRGYAECVDTNYRRSVRDQGMRHKTNSTVYQEYYNNARMNAVVQDAFLGRGTRSPYLAIFNHTGLRLDENAPKRVPDEMMRMIGPSAAVRRLEQEMEALQAALQQKHGCPSWAPDNEKRQYESIKAQLSTARQKQRRKVFRKTYKDYFAESDDKELQNQLQGIHEPVVEREVTHNLPERRVLAGIMGDMDEDLPEEDIVRRKIEAINAMVAYAFVCEPLQRAQPEPRAKPLPAPPPKVILPILPGRPIAVKPGLAQNTPSPPAPEIPLRSPPPPYSEFDSGAGHRPTIPTRDAAITPGRRRSPYARKKPDPCIFCGKTYTRTNVLWDHLEDHLERAKGGPLACPREECKGMVLESPGRFKAHAARFHGSSFRVRIKLVTSESVKSPVGSARASARPITLVPSENQARPPGSGPMCTPTRTRIVLRIGGKKA